MAVKVVLNESTTNMEFPLLMVTDNGSLVYFIAHREGLAIKHPEGVNYYSNWDMKQFKPFTGSVTLSNE